MEEILVAVIAVNAIVESLIDDDDENMNVTSVLEKSENFAEYTVPNFNDRQFKEHFRLLPETFELLLAYIHDSNTVNHNIHRGQPEILIEKQMMITLWCLANVESFRSVADRFGISKSCCWRVLYRTCHRLLNVNLRRQIICFPSGERVVAIMNRFEHRNGFPGIIGIIDGCHIRIEKPNEFPNSYINRKGFPSVLLQGICDDQKLVLDVYAGEPGSIHDSRLFAKSDIYDRITNNHIEFPNDGHLIGDLAYTLSTKLLVGFKDNGQRTEPQKFFNQKLSQNRVLIENAFGLLKCRFRRLKMLETKRLDLISLLIISACILHNVCILNGDFYEGLIEQEERINEEINDIIEGPAAIAKRNNIVNYLYNRFHE